MADSILRLKVDSQEYDQKIKRAAEGIQQYAQKCREVGGTLEKLDDGVLEFVQSLGQMDTVAKSSKQQLREMSNALTTLTQTYRELTDEEKAAPFGQELAKGIQQLTQRAGQAKDAMMDVERSIKNAASDTRTFDRLTQGMSAATATFQGLTGAAKMLGLEMGDNVEVIAKLQAAMAVTNSLTTVQTALQKESALMQGVLAVQAKAAAIATELETSATKGATVAQAAFNAVAKANPYVLLASAVAAVGTALFAFTNNAKKATDATKTETDAMKEATRMADIWKNSLQSTFSSLMTKYDELKRQWQSLKDEHSKTDWINKNKQALASLGGAVNDVKSAEDFFNNNTDAVVQSFVRRAQAAARVAQLTELYRKQIELLDKKEQVSTAIREDAARSGRSAQAGQEIKDSSYWNSRYGSVDREGKWRFHEQGAKLYSGTDTSTADSVVKIDVQIKANEAEIKKVKSQITDEFKDVTITPGSGGGSGSGKQLTKPEQAKAKYNQAEKDYQQALAQVTLELDAKKIDIADARKKERDAAESLWKSIGDAREIYASDELKKAQEDAAQKVVELGGSVNALIEDQKKAQEAARELTAAQKKAAEANQKMADSLAANDYKAYSAAYKQYTVAQSDVQRLQPVEVPILPKWEQTFLDALPEELKKYGSKGIELPVSMTYTQNNLSAFIGRLNEQLSQAPLGTTLYQNLTAQLADANMLANLMQTAVKNGIDAAQFDPQTLFNKIFGENPGDYIKDEKWQEIRKKIEEIIGKPITIDVNTGTVNVENSNGKSAEKGKNDYNKIVGSMSTITGALQQLGVEVPEGFSKTLGILQVISTITMAIQSLAAVTATTSALKAIPIIGWFLHNGGVVHAANGYSVPGNHYSNDMVPAMLNSGELVLNKVQQGNLASQLQDSGNNGNVGRSMATIESDQIRIVLQNGAQAKGMTLGEYLGI